jgi:hypothetical protein
MMMVMVMVNEARLPIDEGGASCVVLLGLLFTKGNRKAAGQCGHFLVQVNHIIGTDRIIIQVAFACVKSLCGR